MSVSVEIANPSPASSEPIVTPADASAVEPSAPAATGPDTSHRGPAGRGAGRVEGMLGAVLPVLLALGVFLVAFVHVHDVAVWAGQPDWASWLIAVSVELMALASTIEIRHRRRIHAGLGWPVATLLAGIGMSGAANLAAADPGALTGNPGPWVRVMALWPVLAFGLVAGLKATRPDRHTPDRNPGRPTPGPTGPRTGQDRSPAGPDRAAPPGDADTTGPATRPLPADLVTVARLVADDLTRQGRPLTRTALAHGVRARGRRCSTDRSTLLLAAVRHANGNDDPAP
jgi:hypothetical protein